MTNLLITIFLGMFGVHKFRQGKIGMGILYFFTFGIFGFGWLFDIIIAAKNLTFTSKPINRNSITNLPTRQQSFTQNTNSLLLSIPSEIRNLLWIGDGPNQNYITEKKHNEVILIDEYSISFSTYGTEEPSLIYFSLPIIRPVNTAAVPRPPYYPSYTELTAEQRWMYWQFLASPYTGMHDIGYVFIFYYGLERILFSSQSQVAFEVILKLRDCYSNPSFQSYSSTALILYAISKRDVALASKFIESLDKKYEMKIPAYLFVLLKYSLALPLTAYELMHYSKAFSFTNQRYIKNDPSTYLGFLQEEIKKKYSAEYIPLSKLLSNININKIKLIETPLFANISIIDKVVKVPDLISCEPFCTEMHQLLLKAHESTKHSLTNQRKQTHTEQSTKVTVKE